MSPRTQFTKEDVIQAAFEVGMENGIDGITIRTVADKLGSSVAPIYVNFENRDHLIEAVVQHCLKIQEEMVKNANTGMAYLDIGASMLATARYYPKLYFDLVNPKNCYSPPQKTHPYVYEQMRKDTRMKDLPQETLENIHQKIEVFTYGLAMSLTQGMWSADLTDAQLIDLLREIGEDIIYAAIHRPREG